MGNHLSCLMQVGNNKETVKLVWSDGSVRILNEPSSAAQIMQEFPHHLICHSHSFYIAQKTPSLFPNDQLKVGNVYFILPRHFFQSPLSLVSLASLISPPPPEAPLTRTAHLSAPLQSIERVSALCQPFEIEKRNMGGGPRIRVSTEFIIKLMEDARLMVDERGHTVGRDSAENDEPYRLCNTRELLKHYEQLVKPRGQRWTPKLETIREKGMLGTM